MFASLQTLRTHSLLFQYDVANALPHTEHVKRSLQTSKIEKKAKSADLVVLSQSHLQRVRGDVRTGMRWNIFFTQNVLQCTITAQSWLFHPPALLLFEIFHFFVFVFVIVFFEGSREAHFQWDRTIENLEVKYLENDKKWWQTLQILNSKIWIFSCNG